LHGRGRISAGACEAASRAAALESLAKHRVDLLFTDVVMPGGSTAGNSPMKHCADGPPEDVVHGWLYRLDAAN
jgi:CheY-like chemotaxis protein